MTRHVENSANRAAGRATRAFGYCAFFSAGSPAADLGISQSLTRAGGPGSLIFNGFLDALGWFLLERGRLSQL